MTLTAAQQTAIAARGNVLVVAGAGTGKTRTLVERCVACLLSEQPRASIDEILMVTFTEAAAAEMRQRIRQRLEEERQRQSDDARWREQLALFETAHFGTLHSFCFQLVRQHFYQLELDPQMSVLAQDEARLLAEETLDRLLQGHYAGQGATARAVQQLIQTQGRGWDKPICSLVLRLHHYGQTLPDPTAWLQSQLALFATPEPLVWRQWLAHAVAGFPLQWLPVLDSLSSSNQVAAHCAAAARQLGNEPSAVALAVAFGEITLARQNCPRGKKTLWIAPLDDFFAEADFLSSLICAPGGPDPLTEDWTWVRDPMKTLLELSDEFSRSFSEAKRELGVVDFHDLEQFSLRLLWDPATNQPTAVARDWQTKLRFIFVDEYQDINAAQDQIIRALARADPEANRFLVGDVKQSIYRFRLANPHIFQSYVEEWSLGAGQVLPLVDNFRSREGLLDFINSVFSLLITRDLGGVDYAANAALRFGAPHDRAALSAAADPKPAVELHLLLKGGGEIPEDDEDPPEGLAEVIDLLEADKEARLVALRLRELQAQQHPIWDLETRRFRPVQWGDMAILLRSPARKAESYAKEFARLNLPLQMARGGFYRSLEVSDLLSLLQLLDNPLQDLPALAVLHSPLVGLTADELAEIRLTALKVRFWTALRRWHQNRALGPRGEHHRPAGEMAQASVPGAVPEPETFRKVSTFLERFVRWRHLARQASLSRCLENVLAETHYASWVLTQPRGAQRHANLQRFITLAQEFDRFQRQGLFRFLKFIEAQQVAEAEPEVAACSPENAVRLMSIHQSKGLEFPVVVVADLGKPFNLTDLRAEIILDEQFGLCPQVEPPHSGNRYPSLPCWLARRRQLRELLGEELRLLYVAMTRARDTLILSGTVAQNKLSGLWQQPRQPSTALLAGARAYTDWLGLWFSLNARTEAKDGVTGETTLLRWSIHDPAQLLGSEDQTPVLEPAKPCEIAFESEAWRLVQQRLSWQYRFSPATQQPAKTSVSVLRRQAGEANQDDEAAHFLALADPSLGASAPICSATGLSQKTRSTSKLSAAGIGSAHHEFLQLVSLDRTGSALDLSQEAHRLQRETRLTPEQLAVLDFDGLAFFWDSTLGRRIRAEKDFVQRELAFTARFAPAELRAISDQARDPSLEGEFVLVQGVVDLAVIAPKGIWLIDFKTDQLVPNELAARVKTYEPQLRLYSAALSKIYQRPVSESWIYFLGLREAVPVDLEMVAGCPPASEGPPIANSE